MRSRYVAYIFIFWGVMLVLMSMAYLLGARP